MDVTEFTNALDGAESIDDLKSILLLARQSGIKPVKQHGSIVRQKRTELLKAYMLLIDDSKPKKGKK